MSRGLAATALAAAMLPSCGARSDAPAERALLTVAEPALDRMEPAVARRLREARASLPPSDAGGETAGAAYGALGKLYHAYELFGPARDCYVNATRLLPGEHRWAYYLGQVQRSLEDLEAAEAAFERASSLKPEDVPTLLALARARGDLGRPEEARELAQAALAIDSTSAGARLLLAQLASARLDHATAIAQYTALLEAQPSASRLHQPLAMAYRALGDIERAREILVRQGDGPLVVADPLLSEIQRLRLGGRSDLAQGVAAFERGDFPAAAQAFRSAVQALPDDADARVNLGSALSKLGEVDAALAEFRKATTLDPGHATAYFNIGTLSARLGDDAAAADAFREALRLRADYAPARFNLANALRRQGRCDRALEHYQYLVEADPGNRAPRLGEIVCATAEGRHADAARSAEAALEALPRDLVLVDAAARLLAASPDAGVRDGQRALVLARRLVAARRDPRHLETLAMARAQLGGFDRAQALQREALSLTDRVSSGMTARLTSNLERYAAGQPCRDPALIDERD